MKAAHALQDAIKVEQAAAGTFEVPDWDQASQDKVREALSVLGALGGIAAMFGTKGEVDPVQHLIGTAVGWGGNPDSAAVYLGVYPKQNDGKTVYRLTVKDVPVDGFWSISVYNARATSRRTTLNAYSLNNLTAKPNADGSFTIQFGGCRRQTPNCLPIMPGWNYTVRLYRPRKEILDGQLEAPGSPARIVTSVGGAAKSAVGPKRRLLNVRLSAASGNQADMIKFKSARPYHAPALV